VEKSYSFFIPPYFLAKFARSLEKRGYDAGDVNSTSKIATWTYVQTPPASHHEFSDILPKLG